MINSLLFNPCRVAIPVTFLSSRWVRQAWDGVDPKQVWDSHVHLAGLGDGDSRIEIGPQLSSLWHPLHYAQRLFYLNAGCAHRASGQVDATYAARLLNLCVAMPVGFKVLLFAFERFHDETGQPDSAQTAFYIPNEWAARLAAEFPAHFEWAASIHPYRADAVDALQTALAQNACAIKWLPAAMGMDPAAKRCDGFYRALAATGTPLIIHCGEEKAVRDCGTDHLGNPLRLRRALDAGVRVIVAHCASLGQDIDLDQGERGPRRASFDLFLRLFEESRATDLLYGDISAITQCNRKLTVIRTLLERNDLHDRLLHGSDYPLPGIVPLTWPAALARNGLLPTDAVPDLCALREHNPLLFDFTLKRLLCWQGHCFPATVFHTRPFFQQRRAIG
ncbi:Amidohydrolase 2 [Candidatus Competibacter denitrificans Run_A_D11]|uniref:Amidohydrolase 2 n=1 Tax=Candidatus Competibacter denitrificans Run_A_D11 TaxID=1400863 RepID=W6M1Y6_9GAMM|nr:amidohydrolase family protein [Candidatus Competibacter denitrificans]CDI01461.1 Amidohydrolase 2 [Candidatus Competibacter denitrificans Run_A_D11]HRC68522.1 amidohydrolase family protein [Candidatus Competibacter denitrificans]